MDLDQDGSRSPAKQQQQSYAHVLQMKSEGGDASSSGEGASAAAASLQTYVSTAGPQGVQPAATRTGSGSGASAGAANPLGGMLTNPRFAVLAAVAARMKESCMGVLRQQKPWSELLDRTAMSKPASMGEVCSCELE